MKVQPTYQVATDSALSFVQRHGHQKLAKHAQPLLHPDPHAHSPRREAFCIIFAFGFYLSQLPPQFPLVRDIIV